MDQKVLNKICLSICRICVFFGTLVALLMIWANFSFGVNAFLFKVSMSAGVLFVASALTLIASLFPKNE